MNEMDVAFEEETERPSKPRKQQEKRTAHTLWSDDGYQAARKTAFKQRKQAYR